jgi:alpha-tubulin suppressor-like RCC1 family protein
VKIAVNHTCALTTKGKVKCWGYNGTGQLGDNSTTNSLKPVGVYNLDKSTKLTVGSEHSCVVTAKKAVKCWGSNTVGQIGDNTTTTTLRPVKVFGY